MSTTRGYLSDALYQRITGKPTLGTDADKLIERAEAIVDGLLGFWQPFMAAHIQGVAVSGDAGTMQMSAQDVQSLPGVNYLKGCVVEMLSGAAEGEYRVITGQTKLGALTFDTDFSQAIAAGDLYHIYQMGKIPRAGESDVQTLNDAGTTVYARMIPQALREAVAWQLAYMQELGEQFMNGQSANMASESFNGAYSYQKADTAKGDAALVAPRARTALRGSGLINRTAQMTGY